MIIPILQKENTETQNGLVTCPRSPSWRVGQTKRNSLQLWILNFAELWGFWESMETEPLWFSPLLCHSLDWFYH